MPVWCVTGKLGAGKTLVAVGRIQKYLNANRRIATNLNLNLEKLVNINAKKTTVYRLPDVPTIESFAGIGLGYDGEFVGDHKNGLVVLDECAKWLNSREWNDKARKKLIDYFVHLRKKRWDAILIIQDKEAIDKQFRTLYCEHIVYCSRADRYPIPFIGGLLKAFFGERIPLPRIHIGNVYYCVGPTENHVENWIYRGTSVMDAYDTEQGFDENTSPMLFQYLPPYTTTGRYTNNVEQFKKALKKFKVSHFFLMGLLLGGFGAKALETTGNSPDRGNWLCNADWEQLFGDCTMTKIELLTIVDNHKNKTAEIGASPAPLGVGDAPILDVFDYLYITASNKTNNTFDYVFYNGYGNVWTPEANDYKVYWVDYCLAKLIGMEGKKLVTCNPKVSTFKEPINI
jgi:hypothetical protein